MDDIIKEERRLKKLRRKLNELRRACRNLRPKQVSKFAEKFGRKEDTKRGKDPQYINTEFPSERPLSIPNHPGALAEGTALSILDQLEGDLFLLEERLEEEKTRRSDK